MHSKKAITVLGLFLALPLAATTLPSGPEVVVKSGDHHYQRTPAAAVAPNGDTVVVWADANLGIRARLLDAHGVAGAELALVANLNHPPVPGEARVTDRKDPVVTYDASGSTFFVFWTNEIADDRVDYFIEDRKVIEQDVFGQRFDLSGHAIGDAFRVNTGAAGFQSRPQVARIQCGSAAPPSCVDGALVVAWQSDDLVTSSGPGEGVFARTLDSEGAPGAGQKRLAPPSPARNVSLAADQRGNFLALWDAPDNFVRGVFARLFDAQLHPLSGNPALVNQRVAGRSQDRPSAAYSPASNEFLALWDGNTQLDRYRTFGRLLSATGVPFGSQLPVTAGRSEWEVFPVAAATLDGGFAAIWLAYDGHLPNAVRGVELGSNGARVGDEFNLSQNRPGSQARLGLALGLSGDLLSTYEGFDARRSTSINLRWLKRTH